MDMDGPRDLEKGSVAVGPPDTFAERAAKMTDSEKKIVVRNGASMRRAGRTVRSPPGRLGQGICAAKWARLNDDAGRE